ncbi:bifunctional 4-hydroxy-2-oxoglutarate aldolase/2-dehydro-3-deoxy-phosphogluconate aldolase [Chitinimonas sp. DQS-5]|uniref:2-dehydro-3-deoxy-phosphogluconate aldolase n=2 Tax=Parachitinimonas caeni TaxID=3031301 RepID=A0ABT7DV63_9NEIS|nr:bifunctional 4-hydroxy-2-oxoglutarate aldolase/2-dehydro-3-deoxy-phosphogluconate aldolase [Parachitinimonas caeni]
MQIREIMKASPVMPVIVVERVEQAVPLARALVAGGIKVLEVTLRTDAALDAVKRIAAEVPEAIVGVGTVTRPEQFAAAKAAGAAFAVTPGLTSQLANAASGAGLPLLPGVMTPSEVIAARAAGFDAMKLFPAEQAGGIGMLKALAGPFPEVLFCPTGGVTLDLASHYLALANVGCVGGSWLAPKDKLAAGDWAAITRLAAEAAQLRR